MKRWVVTGPIGAGKSLMTGHLAAQGAAIIDGDALGHELLAQSDVVSSISGQFEADCIVDGHVDRSRLGALVFADPLKMTQLNQIIHPKLSVLAGQRLDLLAQAGEHDLAVLEAAVYFLLPMASPTDLVISVVAEPEIRLARLMASRGLDRTQAQIRIGAQDAMADLWSQADIVVPNNGPLEDLIAATDDLLKTYL